MPKPWDRTSWLPRITSVNRGRSLFLRLFAKRCNGGQVHGGITSQAWRGDAHEEITETVVEPLDVRQRAHRAYYGVVERRESVQFRR